MCRSEDHAVAERNLIALQQNPYPGRGLVVGVDQSGLFLVQIYWIMGRGDDSRNRVFEQDGGQLRTVIANPAKAKDTSNRIYNAMQEKTCGGKPPAFYIVSNGDQTDTVFTHLSNRINPYYTYLPQALRGRYYEPDPPNSTSRITAVTHHMCDCWRTEIAIIRKSMWGDDCDRLHFQYTNIAKGFGFCVTTYSGDGDPLPAFTGEPLLMPVPGSMRDILSTYWASLNEANRVSLAVKMISIKTGKSIILVQNKYSKVA